jgi:hypothetical protein
VADSLVFRFIGGGTSPPSAKETPNEKPEVSVEPVAEQPEVASVKENNKQHFVALALKGLERGAKPEAPRNIEVTPSIGGGGFYQLSLGIKESEALWLVTRGAIEVEEKFVWCSRVAIAGEVPDADEIMKIETKTVTSYARSDTELLERSALVLVATDMVGHPVDAFMCPENEELAVAKFLTKLWRVDIAESDIADGNIIELN